MKLLKIFRSEFAYQMRSLSTRLYFAVLFAFTIFMNLVTTPGDGIYANNTFYITSIMIIGGLLWLVMGGAVAGQAAARDVKTRMHPLTYTAPVAKLEYLGGKFLAAFAVNALLVVSLPIGVLFSFYFPGMDHDGLGPFRSSVYLNGFFLVALPNVFVATALQFTFAALSRQVMASYLASLLLAVFPQIVATAAAALLGNWELVELLDPVGIAGILGSEMATWTATEKNTRLVTLEGVFFWNRVLWVGVAAWLLWITYLRFSFANTGTVGRSGIFGWRRANSRAQAPPLPEAGKTGTVSVLPVPRKFGLKTSLRQALAIARASFKKTAKNPVGLTLVGAIVLVLVAFGDKILTGLGIPLLPTTQQVLGSLTAPLGTISLPWIVIPLLLIYLAGELVWQERDAGLGDISDAAPVSDWVLLAGKFMGLALIIVTWMAMLMAGGILMQLVLGYDKFEISLYLQALFGLQLLDYLLFALLALVVHVLVDQKYIAFLVMLLIFSFIVFPSKFNVRHNMLIFGAGPVWSYSDMRGFGHTIGPWLCFKAYWAAWSLLLAAAARLFWARGRKQGVKGRFRLAKRRFVAPTAWIAVAASVLILITGSFVFYNTNVLNEYRTVAGINEWKAKYERRYGQYRSAAQPQLAATRLQVEIYPDRQQIDIRGSYSLVNEDAVPISSVHLGSISGIEPYGVKFSRPLAKVLIDDELSHRIYTLARPLMPGDSLQLDFMVHYKQRGFGNDGAGALVMENGTCFTNYDLLPAIGYQRYREIDDPVTRKQYKLAARPAMPSVYDSEARKRPLSMDRNGFEAVIGTVRGETAVAPGTLRQSWTKGGRSYFHFRTDAPIRGEYSILSGNYAMRESKWNDIAIRIYHHPGHVLNIDRMLRSVKASLAYYTEQFGPYPFKHFTVVERPGSGGGASSEAAMVDYREQFSLMNPDDGPDGFDLPYYILAHEVAHQWWGGAGIMPADVEGAGVLVEGLAVYSGMQVLEKAYGDGHLQRYVNFLHSFYEMPRSLATASLLRANEPFLYYRKGGLAMYALSRYIGKEKVNGALRNLLEKHRAGALPPATTLDLYGELQEVTPDSLRYLLDDLFRKNTYWRLKTEQFSAEQGKTGNWQATLEIRAQKVVVDSTGREKEVPMDDWLEIGVFGEGGFPRRPLYLQMHRIRSGVQTIKVKVPRKPGRAGIDPNHLMIDLRLDDNMIQTGG
jgi:ABC-type transport system involved in multi-copper enzyme maturation permease subunit